MVPREGQLTNVIQLLSLRLLSNLRVLKKMNGYLVILYAVAVTLVNGLSSKAPGTSIVLKGGDCNDNKQYWRPISGGADGVCTYEVRHACIGLQLCFPKVCSCFPICD
jgi:hypothetical protein